MWSSGETDPIELPAKLLFEEFTGYPQLLGGRIGAQRRDTGDVTEVSGHGPHRAPAGHAGYLESQLHKALPRSLVTPRLLSGHAARSRLARRHMETKTPTRNTVPNKVAGRTTESASPENPVRAVTTPATRNPSPATVPHSPSQRGQ